MSKLLTELLKTSNLVSIELVSKIDGRLLLGNGGELITDVPKDVTKLGFVSVAAFAEYVADKPSLSGMLDDPSKIRMSPVISAVTNTVRTGILNQISETRGEAKLNIQTAQALAGLEITGGSVAEKREVAANVQNIKMSAVSDMPPANDNGPLLNIVPHGNIPADVEAAWAKAASKEHVDEAKEPVGEAKENVKEVVVESKPEVASKKKKKS
jgi:hypothetical protein